MVPRPKLLVQVLVRVLVQVPVLVLVVIPVLEKRRTPRLPDQIRLVLALVWGGVLVVKEQLLQHAREGLGIELIW